MFVMYWVLKLDDTRSLTLSGVVGRQQTARFLQQCFTCTKKCNPGSLETRTKRILFTAVSRYNDNRWQ